MRNSSTFVGLAALATLLGCSGSGTGDDGGLPSDSGTISDAGTTADAGSGNDAGTVADSGTPQDAGSDAGQDTDAGSVNGCVDFTSIADQSNPTIFFGGGLALRYSPKCAIVRAGQSVTFSGAFQFHPLAQTSGPDSVILTTDGGTSAKFAFNTTGTYGFTCLKHAALGMNGAIQVVDSDAGIDAGVNGCGEFTDISGGDVTDGGNAPTVTFGGNLHYEPQCASITAGQSVTFAGAFGFHPLAQTDGPVVAITGADSGTSATFTFSQPGTYGYECLNHAPLGMKGAIQVH